MSNQQYYLDKIAIVEAAIEAAETAELELIAGNINSYTLDTGQTRTVITKNNLTSLRSYLDSLYNRREIFRKRAGLSSGSHYAGASW